jgi:hypothetical protein
MQQQRILKVAASHLDSFASNINYNKGSENSYDFWLSVTTADYTHSYSIRGYKNGWIISLILKVAASHSDSFTTTTNIIFKRLKGNHSF